jgi:hypothetical protein
MVLRRVHLFGVMIAAGLALLTPSIPGCGDTLIHAVGPPDGGVGGQGGGGGPVVHCPAPTISCGGACFDPAVSNEHCGLCSISCSDGSFCEAGACTCVPGQTKCGDICTDVGSDPANCHACGHACDPGEVCEGGVCGKGDCGSHCEGGTCIGDVCTCTSPETACFGHCVDLRNDDAHCGSCPHACGSKQTCVNRHCVDGGNGGGGNGNGGNGSGGSSGTTSTTTPNTGGGTTTM